LNQLLKGNSDELIIEDMVSEQGGRGFEVLGNIILPPMRKNVIISNLFYLTNLCLDYCSTISWNMGDFGKTS